MPAPASTDAEFIELYADVGPMEVARRYGITARAVLSRRRRLEQRHSTRINAPEHPKSIPIETHPHRIVLTIPNGICIVAGDAHYWPGEPSPAHRAFVAFVKRLKPVAVIANGDLFDGARISRHPPIGWTKLPTVKDELEVVQERSHEIVMACPKGTRRIWTLGNHDARFETRLATVAPEYADVVGVSLQDHFPLWEPAWSCFINDDVVVKHRFKGGMHAPQNNTLWGGRTFVTGHLHSQKVQPITDYNGTRYGVDAGCLADPDARAFVDYTEDAPKNWRAGFCVLTFKDGKLLMPELVTVWDSETVQFRGDLIRV
jgi:hypothetical protein